MYYKLSDLYLVARGDFVILGLLPRMQRSSAATRNLTMYGVGGVKVSICYFCSMHTCEIFGVKI